MRCAGGLRAPSAPPSAAAASRRVRGAPPAPRPFARVQLPARRAACVRRLHAGASAEDAAQPLALQDGEQPPSGDAVARADGAEWLDAAAPLSEAEWLSSLGSGAAAVTLESLQQCFPYRFDKFQKRALQGILAAKSVVVSAPTGSGKTLVAEAAIVATLAAGKRAFYTTPLKALSNQKLREFRERFGVAAVGLKTGDAAINPDARIVVMTTEILRNMLYRSAGGAAPDAALAGVGLVVLDEVHYLADADRGTVWEECVIYCPDSVPLLCLSATVGNPDDLQGWIGAVHGECELVTSAWRPVPLSFYFAKRGGGGGGDGDRGGSGLAPLLSRRGDRMNRALEAGGDGEEEARGGSGPRFVSSWRRDAPSQESVVRHLVREQLLPAIWFIFSRARCDEAVAAMFATEGLVTAPERARLAAALAALQAACPEAVRPEYAEPLLAGVAAHHAGCLPAWKALVEELFQEGLIKLVFATETLAAGINMPARAVVLSSTSKRDAEGPRPLTTNEFMQIAGRAGRRGYDTQGATIVVQSPFEGPDAAAQLALGEPEPLVSRFAVSYGMVLNLLRGRSLAQVQTVVNASFGNFLRSLSRAARGTRHAALSAELELLRANMSPKVLEAERALAAMTKLRGRMQEERRALRMLQQQLAQGQPVAAAAASADGADAAPHWLLEKPLPVPVLLRVAPGGAARDASREPSQSWGELALDGAEDAEELDDALDALAAGDDFYGDAPLPRGASVEDEAAAGEVVLSAALLALERVSAGDDGALGWEFIALGADNVWYRGGLDAVVGCGDAWLLSPGLVPELPRVTQSGWVWRAGTGRAPGSRASFPAAGRIATALVGVAEGDGMPAPADADAAQFLTEARERIATLERQLAAMTSDTALQKSIRKAATRINRVRVLEASVARLGRRLSETVPAGWGEFQSAVAVLRAMGALRGEDAPELTRLGESAAAVRTQNELWMAMALTSGALDALEPGALAGVVTALLSEETVSRPNTYAAYRPSPAAAEAIARLTPLAEQLDELQARSAFAAPVSLAPQFVGLVESWAAGSDWLQVCRDTSIDEGDVARLLRRVGEFLGQVSDVPHTAASLRITAKAARRLVDRPPISDLIA